MATKLKPGDPAPDFTGLATDGTPLALAQYRGRKLVLYFYPRDDTPGCTRQACSLRDHAGEIAAKGAAVMGVSTQDSASHAAFTRKYRLNFPLLAPCAPQYRHAIDAFRPFMLTRKFQGRIR